MLNFTVENTVVQPQIPGLLALLLPTRGRPQSFLRLLRSLEETTADPKHLLVSCLIDHDDKETQALFQQLSPGTFSFALQSVVSDKTMTQGDRYNLLRARIEPRPEIYMPIADDVVIVTAGWDNLVRSAFERSESKLLLCYPGDTTVLEDQASYTIIHASWTNILGRFASGWFPYWFEDVWVDNIGYMIGEKHKLSFQIVAPEGKGKTNGMRNLCFWERFFRNTLSDRLDEALLLIDRGLSHNPDELTQRKLLARERAAELSRKAPPLDNIAMRRGELELSAISPGTPPTQKYLFTELRAIFWLLTKLKDGVVQADSAAVTQIIDNLLYISPEVNSFSFQVLDSAWKNLAR